MKKDNQTSYGTVTKFLHCAMALAYVAMFATAIAWNVNENLKFLINPHRLIGILLFVLSVVRVVWGIKNAKNRPANGITTKLGHFALYALMLAVPVLGLMRGAGVPLGQAHGALAFLFLALIVGHIAMAIVHQIKGKKILQRII